MIVHRRAYTRADGTSVRATTFEIPNRGAQGRGPKLFTLRKGGLKQYGYSVKKSDSARRYALSIAAMQTPRTTLIRRIVALGTLTKRTHPEYSAIYRANANWVRNSIAR
jgi:hypothetical protein